MGTYIDLLSLALHKESTQSCSNVAKSYNVCLTPHTAVRILAFWLLLYCDITNGELFTGCLKLTTQIVSSWRLSGASLCAFGPVGFYQVTLPYAPDVADVAGFVLDWRIDLISGSLGCFHTWSEERIWYMEIRYQFHGLLQSVKAVKFHQSRCHGSESLVCGCKWNTYANCAAKIWTQFKCVFLNISVWGTM